MDRQIDLMAQRIADTQSRFGGDGTLRIDDRIAGSAEFLSQDLFKHRAVKTPVPPHAGRAAEWRDQLAHSEHRKIFDRRTVERCDDLPIDAKFPDTLQRGMHRRMDSRYATCPHHKRKEQFRALMHMSGD